MKTKFYLTVTAAAVLMLAACRSTKDMEQDASALVQSERVERRESPDAAKQEISPADQAVEDITASIDMEKKIVYVEKPVYVPQEQPEKIDHKTVGYDAGVQVVNNIVQPEEYNGSAMVYDFDNDFVYEIYVKVFSTTDIYLQPGEQIVGEIANSDSVHINTGKAASVENGYQLQHVLIKPTEAGLQGTITIFTDRRTYHCVIRSYKNTFMPIVRWRYIDSGLPQMVIRTDRTTGAEINVQKDFLDPRYLSFNYKMSFSAFKKPAWTPVHVYDDGKKTYIVFPEKVLQKNVPGCYENNDEIVNFRVDGDLYVIDKLIEKVTFKLGREKVKVWKKRGV